MTYRAALGDRMKGYEATTQFQLLRRTPVIIRVDGQAFHTFTRRFREPFSDVFHKCMEYTAQNLFLKIQNAVFVYTQSDEISILLRDWDKHETEQWFGGNVQKIVSSAAAIATGAFNVAAHEFMPTLQKELFVTFDGRASNYPREEVTNYFIWRQQDASRNSIQALGHAHFSQREMDGKNNIEVQDMLMLQKGINWNDIETWKKRGLCIYRGGELILNDHECPIFTQDRAYIEQHLIGEETISVP